MVGQWRVSWILIPDTHREAQGCHNEIALYIFNLPDVVGFDGRAYRPFAGAKIIALGAFDVTPAVVIGVDGQMVVFAALWAWLHFRIGRHKNLLFLVRFIGRKYRLVIDRDLIVACVTFVFGLES